MPFNQTTRGSADWFLSELKNPESPVWRFFMNLIMQRVAVADIMQFMMQEWEKLLYSEGKFADKMRSIEEAWDLYYAEQAKGLSQPDAIKWLPSDTVAVTSVDRTVLDNITHLEINLRAINTQIMLANQAWTGTQTAHAQNCIAQLVVNMSTDPLSAAGGNPLELNQATLGRIEHALIKVPPCAVLQHNPGLLGRLKEEVAETSSKAVAEVMVAKSDVTKELQMLMALMGGAESEIFDPRKLLSLVKENKTKAAYKGLLERAEGEVENTVHAINLFTDKLTAESKLAQAMTGLAEQMGNATVRPAIK